MTSDELKLARKLFLQVAWAYHGTPYIWGGDDPAGFDCSGLVVECLKSIGLMRRKEDATAHMLWNEFRARPANPNGGDLVFWYSKHSRRLIVHVEIVVSRRLELSIGASGGGSKTKTRADAMKQNAFIKLRKYSDRPYLAGFADPFAGTII